MNIINYFSPQPDINELPNSFSNPFDNNPHILAIKAANFLKHYLRSNSLSHSFFNDGEGKMFGVLVIANKEGKVGYLSAFSGMLQNKWVISGFVPPIFNVDDMSQLLSQGEKQLDKLKLKITGLENDQKREALRHNLESYKFESNAELVNLKQTHRINKQRRKKLRENSSVHANGKDDLLNLSQQSQDDKREYKALKSSIEIKINSFEQELSSLFESKIGQLKNTRKKLSQDLHKQVFNQYQIHNHNGLIKPIDNFFENKLPPGGTADCAAPKLIQYALTHGLKTLALSEFWWGTSPKKEIRHHQQSYPPCRSKCHHIIPFMLEGLKITSIVDEHLIKLEPKVIYEDESIIVLNKPEGMLSIPGKEVQESVLTWLQNHYSNAEGGLLLHRLDQATSGIMLAAKNSSVYQLIQQQFVSRSIKKRYVALLSKKLQQSPINIDLPLRVDLEDRPRQLVCFEHGKQAHTKVELIQHEGNISRVYFYPKTGRTHQLRVHAAHELGLANPIVGDSLYGKKAERLMLHAERIEFFHPAKKEKCIFQVNAPF